MPVSQLPDGFRLLEGLRVLVLEDEVLIAMDVEQICYDNGAAGVVTVRDLGEIDQDAIPALADVVIVDLMLGGVSTLDFARRLHETGVPFVFASGYTDVEELTAAFPDIALIAKPYAGADLVDAVAAACGRKPATPA